MGYVRLQYHSHVFMVPPKKRGFGLPMEEASLAPLFHTLLRCTSSYIMDQPLFVEIKTQNTYIAIV